MSIDKLTELVIAAKKKDNGAISMLYEQTHQRIYFSVLMIIKNEQDALDIMQETYISAIRKLASLKNPEAFEGWLQAIARNKCLNFLKKHKELLIDDKEEHLFEQIKDTSDEFLPAEALENKEMQEVILESVKSLPVKLSQTVMYYYFDEMTTIEIASLMSCPTSTVSRRLAAARDRIKKDLEGKKGVFTIMPLPILTNIFKQAIKENTKWMVSAQQSATCLEGIFAGIHLSTGSIKYGFSEDKLIFSDRSFTFVRLPDFMGNLERIQLACDSKFSQKDVAKFIAGDEITVYIGMDARAVAKGPPAWMDSWSLDNDTAFLSNDVTFIFYKKDFNKGEEVILGTNGDPLSVIMYTVFVSPKAIH